MCVVVPAGGWGQVSDVCQQLPVPNRWPYTSEMSKIERSWCLFDKKNWKETQYHSLGREKRGKWRDNVAVCIWLPVCTWTDRYARPI